MNAGKDREDGIDVAVRGLVAGDAGEGAFGAADEEGRALLIGRAVALAGANAGAGRGGRRARKRVMAAVAAGAVAAAAAAILVSGVGAGRGAERAAASAVAARADRGEVLGRFARGQGGAVVAGREIEVREAGAVVELGRGIRLSPSAGSAFSVRRGDAKRLVVALRRGAVWSEVDPQTKSADLSIETPRGVVSVKGTVFLVAVEGAVVRVQVARGLVEVRENDGTLHLVPAGETLALGAPLPAAPEPGAEGQKVEAAKAIARAEAAPSADALLTRVRALRLAGDWPGVADAYEQLIRLHFATDDARAAMVALGTIRLEKLDDPAGALGAFSSYLDTKADALAPEALYGKACALGKLGDAAAERDALREFVARYPASPQIGAARSRLAALAAE